MLETETEASAPLAGVESLPIDRAADLGVHAQHPEVVIAALRDNLLGMAAQIPEPALSQPLTFFGRLADWAASTSTIPARVDAHARRTDTLRAEALELGVDGGTLGDLMQSLASEAEHGNLRARSVLLELLAELKAMETEPVEAVIPQGVDEANDVDAVSSYLAERFGQGAHAATVTVIPGGYSKTTLLIDAVIDGQVQQVVLRQVPAGQSQETLKPEFDVLKAIWSPGMLVPEPLWLEENDSAIGGPFFASRRSPGTPLGTVAGAGGAAVPPQVITDLAVFLASLHTLDATCVVDAPVLPMRNEQEIRSAIDDLVTRCRTNFGEPSPRLRAAIGWLHANVPTTLQASIVHGDPGFQNTLAENGRMTAALDWERAHVGDPAEDLAYVMPSVSEVFDWNAFMDAYVEAGGHAPDPANLTFYLVWQDVWRHVECIRLGESFYSSRIFSSAIAGFVLGPQFLDSALTQAFPNLSEVEA